MKWLHYLPPGYGKFTGAEKAAILILAIGESQGGKVFSMLHDDEIREISKAMVQLGQFRRRWWSSYHPNLLTAW